MKAKKLVLVAQKDNYNLVATEQGIYASKIIDYDYPVRGAKPIILMNIRTNKKRKVYRKVEYIYNEKTLRQIFGDEPVDRAKRIVAYLKRGYSYLKLKKMGVV